MNHSDLLAGLVADLDVDVVLCAGRWTLLERTAHDDLLPVCARRGTSVVVGGVYNSGLLADPSPGAPYDYAPDRRRSSHGPANWPPCAPSSASR